VVKKNVRSIKRASERERERKKIIILKCAFTLPCLRQYRWTTDEQVEKKTDGWRLNIYTQSNKERKKEKKRDKCMYYMPSLSSTNWLPPAAMTKMKMINIHSNNESVCPHICIWHVMMMIIIIMMMMMTCNSKVK